MNNVYKTMDLYTAWLFEVNSQCNRLDGIKNTTVEMNNLLAELGINVNLAPVADVSNDPSDFIYDRALGGDASQTAEYIKTVIETSKGSKVSNVLKHFPGYGNNKDTHTGISNDERSLDSFWSNDLIPFKTLKINLSHS